jgi:hypothetical protein
MLGQDITLRRPVQLPFAEHMHRLLPLESMPGRAKRPKPQTNIDATFDTAMILRNGRLCQLVACQHEPLTHEHITASVVTLTRRWEGS